MPTDDNGNNNPLHEHGAVDNSNAEELLQHQSEIHKVSVKIPPFWRQNPELWFSQIESQFIMSKISIDATKYHTLVAAIDSSVLSQVSDIILQPPSENLYQTLKKRLIECFADSEQKRMKLLLQDIELGDKKPSQLLLEMKNLAGSAFSDKLVQSLWIQRLPVQTRSILSISSEKLDKLASMADKIHEMNESLSICETSSGNVNFNKLSAQVAALTKKFEDFQSDHFNYNKSHKGRRSRSSSRSKKDGISSRSFSKTGCDRNVICWYHQKYANRAQNCRSPCSFNRSSSENN